MSLAGKIPESILTEVENLKSEKWNSELKAIIKYRTALLAAQNYRCAYCTHKIERDIVGYRELDHILPKSQCPSDKFDDTIASSSIQKDRRHTRGYHQFRYAPMNLVVSCKRCNSFKGSYDPLANRAAPAPTAYPSKTDDFEWVHPHFDDYDKFIEIKEGLLYEAKDGSKKGTAVIKACGLDKSDEITKAIVTECLATNAELFVEMLDRTIRQNPIDVEEIAAALFTRYKVGTPADIEICLRELQGAAPLGAAALQSVTGKICTILQLTGPVYPPP